MAWHHFMIVGYVLLQAGNYWGGFSLAVVAAALGAVLTSMMARGPLAVFVHLILLTVTLDSPF